MNELPIDLQTWITEEAMTQDDQYYAKDAGVRQAMFVRDRIHPLLVRGYEVRKEERPVQVVSTHISKSVKLPVYYIDARPELGIEVYMRENFVMNWMISIKSAMPIRDDFRNLIVRGQGQINPVYCEGFDKEWVLGPFPENPTEFTVKLDCIEEAAWTFFWLISQQLREGRGDLVIRCHESAGFYVTAHLNDKWSHQWSRSRPDAYVLALEGLEQTPQVKGLIDMLTPLCKEEIWSRQSVEEKIASLDKS